MISIRNIIVAALVLLTCETINMYAVGNGDGGGLVKTKTGTGTVNTKVVIPLSIYPYPMYPFPEDGDIPKIGRGDTREMSDMYINYSVHGGSAMDVSLSNNGNGIEVSGTGVTFGTAWLKRPDGHWPSGAPMASPMLAEDQLSSGGNLYLRCYITSITASLDASLGLHQIELTLTAAYKY